MSSTATTKRMEPVEDPKKAETRRVPAVKHHNPMQELIKRLKKRNTPQRRVALWWLHRGNTSRG